MICFDRKCRLNIHEAKFSTDVLTKLTKNEYPSVLKLFIFLF